MASIYAPTHALSPGAVSSDPAAIELIVTFSMLFVGFAAGYTLKNKWRLASRNKEADGVPCRTPVDEVCAGKGNLSTDLLSSGEESACSGIDQLASVDTIALLEEAVQAQETKDVTYLEAALSALDDHEES